MATPDFLPNTLGGLVALVTGSGAFGVGFKSLLDYKKSYISKLQDRVQELEKKNDASDSLCEAKLAVVRHQSNNLAGCLDSVLMILAMLPEEVLPERAKRAIDEVKRQREEQNTAIALERGQVQAAIIAAAEMGHVPAERAEKV